MAVLLLEANLTDEEIAPEGGWGVYVGTCRVKDGQWYVPDEVLMLLTKRLDLDAVVHRAVAGDPGKIVTASEVSPNPMMVARRTVNTLMREVFAVLIHIRRGCRRVPVQHVGDVCTDEQVGEEETWVEKGRKAGVP